MTGWILLGIALVIVLLMVVVSLGPRVKAQAFTPCELEKYGAEDEEKQ